MRQISILGSTGSIGRQSLDIVRAHEQQLKVVALAAGGNHLEQLAEQVRFFHPEIVCVPDPDCARILEELLGSVASELQICYGSQGLITVATCPGSEVVVSGLVGFLGLMPTVAAIKAGKTIALANKETLVAAGGCIMPMAKQFGAAIIPVDSEHSAIFQSLAGYSNTAIEQIILTGSGGPFRTWSYEQMKNATVANALQHPNWKMGPKVTIDSATLMNKGLEIIEAKWLFDVSVDRIKVVIHPQSILHSAIQFVDGSIIGQLGVPDMHLPIHYALFYPERVQSDQVSRLDLSSVQNLSFEEPDEVRFPCLSICKLAADHDDTLPCALNAANEVAVDAFLQQKIQFTDIPILIERVLNDHKIVSSPSLEDIEQTDLETRDKAREKLKYDYTKYAVSVPAAYHESSHSGSII